MDPFMSQKTVSMTIFTDCSAWYFFFTEESVYFDSKDCFQQADSGKLMVKSFLNIFMTKTCFSIHITHSFVNFTWSALLSYKKFHDRLLFKLGVL